MTGMEAETITRRQLRVDFLGTQGVGKTTLSRAVLQRFRENPGTAPGGLQWVGLGTATRIATDSAFRHAIPPMGPMRRLLRIGRMLQHGIKYQLIRGHNVSLGGVEYEMLDARLTEAFIKDNCEFFHLVFSHYRDCWRGGNHHPATHLSDFFMITRNLAIVTRFGGQLGYFMDDYHPTRNLTSVLLSLAGEEDQRSEVLSRIAFSPPIAPTAVVYLKTPDTDLVVQRLKARRERMESQGKKLEVVSESELHARAEKNQARFDSGAKDLRMMGMPVLTLCATTPMEENVAAVRDFLQQVTATP